MRGKSVGWCPNAYAPFMTGDGLMVRIKPAFSRLEAQALIELAELSDRFGSGMLDLTNRANLQIRGVSSADYPLLLSGLQKAGLAGNSEKADRLNLILAPFTPKGSIGWRCARQIYGAFEDFPELPEKFGFGIDCGDRRYLTQASGDLFVEIAASGELLLRFAGRDEGVRTDELSLINDIKKIIDWYLGVIAAHPKRKTLRIQEIEAPYPLLSSVTGSCPRFSPHQLRVGQADSHLLIAAPFGQLTSENLRNLAAVNRWVHFTTGRLMVIKTIPDQDYHLICDAEDRRLRMVACSGAPYCQSASIKTRDLAERLSSIEAWGVDKTIHISGCSKGCAASQVHDICIIGNQGRFDIVEKGNAWHVPSSTSNSYKALFERLGEIGL